MGHLCLPPTSIYETNFHIWGILDRGENIIKTYMLLRVRIIWEEKKLIGKERNEREEGKGDEEE